MRRRDAIAMISVALFGALPLGEARAEKHLDRVGILSPQSPDASKPQWEAFRRRLRELGWEDGNNIAIDARFADGHLDQLRALANELCRSNPDVIVAANSPGVRAAIAASNAIPIVMVEVGDPVATGFVTNLARPTGNVTGVTSMTPQLTQKRLELLHEAVPRAVRIAVVMDPDDPISLPQWHDAQYAADRMGVGLVRLDIRNLVDLRQAFETAARNQADAVLRLADPLDVQLGPELVQLATTYRLPIMLLSNKQVEAGGLMSYFADPIDYYRRAASYVDRVLKGAKPSDLPVEQPTKFNMAINLKTAKTLGLAISPSLLVQADEVIQ
jgi:putative tryptophan/tyrosine transport system substrate-binding protein